MSTRTPETEEIDWARRAEEDLSYEPPRMFPGEFRATLAEHGASYIRDRLRETSYARKLMVPRVIPPEQC